MKKTLGFDINILSNHTDEIQKRQKRVFQILHFSIWVITLISFLSIFFYSTIIFNSWFISLLIGVFISFIIFQIYKILVTSSLNPYDSPLMSYKLNHQKTYEDYLNSDLSNISINEIENVTRNKKATLKQFAIESSKSQNNFFVRFINALVRLSILSLFGFIIADGLELFIFHNHINEAIETITKSLIELEDKDSLLVIDKLLTPSEGKEFLLINANGILLAQHLLEQGLGNFKILIDMIIIFIFFTPLIMTYKSKELYRGEYVIENTLNEIEISQIGYLISKKYCDQLKNKLNQDDFDKRFKQKLINEFQ